MSGLRQTSTYPTTTRPCWAYMNRSGEVVVFDNGKSLAATRLSPPLFRLLNRMTDLEIIILLVIERARNTRSESVRAAEERGEPMPDRLVLTQHDTYRNNPLYPCGEPLKTWVSNNEFAESVEKQDVPEIEFDWNSGRTIYPITQVGFYLDSNSTDVLICEHIGKRYGRGGWYHLITVDGKPALAENTNREQWIS